VAQPATFDENDEVGDRIHFMGSCGTQLKDAQGSKVGRSIRGIDIDSTDP
jgi:hypothetical protein